MQDGKISRVGLYAYFGVEWPALALAHRQRHGTMILILTGREEAV
jgi:hypothetical protein